VNDNRNMILAIVLSALVLLGWGYLSERYFPTSTTPPTKVASSEQTAPALQPQTTGPTASTAVSAIPIRDRRMVLAESPRVRIETSRLQGSVNLRGARIDDLVLATQRETIAANSPPIRLLSPSGAADAYFANFGWTGEGVILPGPDTIWTASSTRLSPGNPVILSWTNPQGQSFQIKLSIDDGYMFTAEQSVTNASASAIAVRPYALISRANSSKDPSRWTSHIGPVGVFNDAANYDWDYKEIAEGGDQRFTSKGGWLGFTDKYWLTAIIPDQKSNIDAAFRRGPAGGFQADFTPLQTIVAPGKSTAYTSHLFAGAKEVQLLDRYQNQLGIAKFDKAIDWGWFEWFMKPIFALLNWLFHSIGNFGLAIICLTLIVRALMFPIAQKQFKSMAGMRVVQPKMKALQERYKDDKPRLQQEMLKLYQEEKVNPMAGCLPILLQIPIFYALYKVLMLAVEMRHQPFVGWIKDLSAPDPLTPVNLFGLLNFAPPTFLALGILPILLGVTMWLQFRLNPAPMDPVQKQMFALMPWVMMFIMAPFAAGLQLYWVTNNLLTIAQQKWLYSRHSGLKEPVAK
jgi:YidC/Oxa1 family membrane protein insertase